MKAISIRQPWAWLIIHGGKDIENRSWSTGLRGRIWVHASKGMTDSEYQEAYAFVQRLESEGWIAPGVSARMPSAVALERGGIIGSVEIVGCVSDSDSPWFVGDFGFELKNPKPHPFTPCRGALNFFQPERPGSGAA